MTVVSPEVIADAVRNGTARKLGTVARHLRQHADAVRDASTDPAVTRIARVRARARADAFRDIADLMVELQQEGHQS